MSQPAVEIQNVSKSFGDTQALQNINLQIHDGEFFSLLGPSGCGKTTLLRMIAGFEFPTSGAVIISGQDMSRVPPHKRPVNMVFQSYALFPHLSVFDNIAFGLKLGKKLSKQEVEAQVRWSLDLVQLPHIAARFPRELSGGQQQRVAFARAIVNKPSVLLLDEPLSALDPKIRQEMQAELARFKKELRITFIMVTHDQAEAFGLSDRIAVMSAGHVEQVDSPENIFARPATPFVADFIGQGNLLTAEILEQKGEFCQVMVGPNLKLWAACPNGASQVAAGQKVTLLIRNAALSLTEDLGTINGGEPVNVFPVEIIYKSFQGETSDFQLKAFGEINLTASLSGEESYKHAAGQSRHVMLPARSAQVIL
ncbi:MAG: ABC transporter ATP-binding protein [Candidatus Obscuribacterales bacterium]|nr:ABC transporter ATP-binding protein [Candidatus Obscuribacterales bacterium]